MSPLIANVKELSVDWEGDVLGLHRRVDGDPGQILRAQRPALVCDAQALGQEQLQLIAEPLAPMGQIRALVLKLVLEEFRAGEDWK